MLSGSFTQAPGVHVRHNSPARFDHRARRVIRPRGRLRALSSPGFRVNRDGLPGSDVFRDSYFSSDGGVEETRHVFLDGNRIRERLSAGSRRRLTVGELGFGTGLNFLCTWSLFRAVAESDQQLHFWSVDSAPLREAELRQALDLWPDLKPLATALLHGYPPPITGIHRRCFDGGRVTLDCVWSDARTALEDLASFRAGVVDAWYLDGFAPARNPAMWDAALFPLLARCSRFGATVASYTAAGAVRRGLEQAGFEVEKRPGFGRKRECIAGRLQATEGSHFPSSTPWDLPDKMPAGPPSSALVLGAGLAGSHAAAALASRGVPVTVLDAGDIAGRASGNFQGVLFHRLSHQHALLGDFSLLARDYAWCRYSAMFQSGQLATSLDGDLSGCLQLDPTGDAPGELAKVLNELPELAAVVDRDTAAEKVSAGLAAGGYWQRRAGWLSPPAVCSTLLHQPGIRTLADCGRLTPAYRDGQWRVFDTHGVEIAQADVVVIATGVDSNTLPMLQPWLPIKPVRGQTTYLDANLLPDLSAALCHSGYIAPAAAGRHCIGATFEPGDHGRDCRSRDHRRNLDALAGAVPGWADTLGRLNADTLEGRAEIRATTPDYLPMVGPVPHAERFRERYATLARDATQTLSEAAPMVEGCYLSTGFGSRGLSYAALAGELLASQICGDIAPLSRELTRALSPARFLLRGIIRSNDGSKAA